MLNSKSSERSPVWDSIIPFPKGTRVRFARKVCSCRMDCKDCTVQHVFGSEGVIVEVLESSIYSEETAERLFHKYPLLKGEKIYSVSFKGGDVFLRGVELDIL